MRFLKVLRLLVVSPRKFVAYLKLRHEIKDRYITLRKVTHLESFQRLHERIRGLQEQSDELLNASMPDGVTSMGGETFSRKTPILGGKGSE